jgi:hypothetical protein
VVVEVGEQDYQAGKVADGRCLFCCGPSFAMGIHAHLLWKLKSKSSCSDGKAVIDEVLVKSQNGQPLPR